MLPDARIQRHGYHLMSLASLGMVTMLVIGVMTSAMPWMPDWNPQWLGWNPAGLSWQQTLTMNSEGKLLLSLAGITSTLAFLIPLMALRRLGDRLYRHDALTRPVADAFRWLAHSVVLHAMIRIAAMLLAATAGEVGGGDTVPLTFSFSSAYLLFVTCICLYSIAHIMRLATEAADDSRSII